MKTTTLGIQTYFSRLLLLLLILVGTGLVLSFSVSYSYSIIQGRNIGVEGTGQQMSIFSLFIKQLLSAVIGLMGVLYLMKTPTRIIQRMTNIIAVFAAIVMIYTVLLAPEINGSKRWISIAGISIQTGDFARVALILYLSNIFSQHHKALLQCVDTQTKKNENQKVLLRFFIAVTIYLGSLYLQRDYSSFMISAIVIISVLLVSDISKRWKFGILSVGIGMFVSIVLGDANRMGRIMQYFQPGGDPLGAGFQIQKSYEIIGNGGWLGSGVGSNMLDVLHLPYFNNDFVFSIIVGEYGLIGAIGVIMLFWLLCWYAYKLGKQIYVIDRYYYFMLLAGVVSLIVSVVSHIAVTIGIVPVAGLNLPFYSSGGSSMVTSLLSYGLILRAARALDYYDKNKREIRNDVSYTSSAQDMRYMHSTHHSNTNKANKANKEMKVTSSNESKKKNKKTVAQYTISNIDINEDWTIKR